MYPSNNPPEFTFYKDCWDCIFSCIGYSLMSPFVVAYTALSLPALLCGCIFGSCDCNSDNAGKCNSIDCDKILCKSTDPCCGCTLFGDCGYNIGSLCHPYRYMRMYKNCNSNCKTTSSISSHIVAPLHQSMNSSGNSMGCNNTLVVLSPSQYVDKPDPVLPIPPPSYQDAIRN
jgi:hypothetical protein